jgi:hypothetical protein
VTRPAMCDAATASAVCDAATASATGAGCKYRIQDSRFSLWVKGQGLGFEAWGVWFTV